MGLEERLQKYMARCGVASRRKCEEIILSGRVKIDGEVVRELGVKVCAGKEKVEVDGKVITIEEKKVYIALNKPVGYLSSVTDDRGRKTILDLVKVEERIYPVGRLDYDTSGLILLTNDGDIYNKIIHPRVDKNKVYIAEVKGIMQDDAIRAFEDGIDIGDYITAPGTCNVLKINNKKALSTVKITIHEGKNRQVRRMCDAVNHPVVSLKRISVGPIELGKLEEGKWRYLTDKEVELLEKQ